MRAWGRRGADDPGPDDPGPDDPGPDDPGPDDPGPDDPGPGPGGGADDLAAAYVSDARHVVLGGCGRSGTTLARVILDSHPGLCCGPESDVFLDRPLPVAALAQKFGLDPAVLADAVARSGSRAELVDRFAGLCCDLAGKPRWAEKTPRNVLRLDWLFEHFPQARFVHLLRDGRDVACSLRTHPRHRVVDGELVPLNTWKPMEECAGRWRDSLLAVEPYLADPRVHTVRYEDLVGDTRGTVAALLDFLGEPWDDAVLAHERADSGFRDATTFPQNPEVLQPVGDTALRRWERDMSAEDRAVFKEVAGDLLVRHGYAADDTW